MDAKTRNCTKSGYGTSITLEASAQESLVINDVFINPTANGYATMYIDNSTQGFFRTDTTVLGNNLPFVHKSSRMKTILGFLVNKKIFSGYPIETGSRFTVKNSSPAHIVIMYDKYAPGAIKSDMENGKDAKSFTYLAYGQPGADVNTSTDTLISLKNNPSEFSNFPFSGAVPSKRKIEIYGFLFSERGADDGTATANYIRTEYLKLIKNREVLFDSDRKGFFYRGTNVTTIGGFAAENYLGVSGENTNLYQKEPFLFDSPLIYEEGEELDTYITTTTHTTPGTFMAKELEMAYILKETIV